MLVAATAMFFAVASSAFILRARMVECSMVPNLRPAPVVVDTMSMPAARGGADRVACGEAIYEPNQDGSVSVYFEMCAPVGQTLVVGESAIEPPRPATVPVDGSQATPAPPAVEGVAVGRIVYER